jgi:hypothetical protein
LNTVAELAEKKEMNDTYVQSAKVFCVDEISQPEVYKSYGSASSSVKISDVYESGVKMFEICELSNRVFNVCK